MLLGVVDNGAVYLVGERHHVKGYCYALYHSVLDFGHQFNAVHHKIELCLVVLAWLATALYVEEVTGDEVVLFLHPLVAKEEHLGRAAEVLNLSYSVGAAFLGEACAWRVADNTAKGYLAATQCLKVVHLASLGVAELVEDDGIVVERVCRQVDAYKLPFAVQALQGAPCAAHGDFGVGYLGHLRVAKERCRCIGLVVLVGVAVAYECLKELVALAVGAGILLARYATRQLVECSGKGKALKVLAVAGGEVHALHKVEYALERTICLALVYDGLHSALAHTLHGAQAKAYVALLVYTELAARLVHVGAKHVYAHALALLHQLGNFGNLVKVAAHCARHVLRRIVGFEVCCLVGNP